MRHALFYLLFFFFSGFFEFIVCTDRSARGTSCSYFSPSKIPGPAAWRAISYAIEKIPSARPQRCHRGELLGADFVTIISVPRPLPALGIANETENLKFRVGVKKQGLTRTALNNFSSLSHTLAGSQYSLAPYDTYPYKYVHDCVYICICVYAHIQSHILTHRSSSFFSRHH